MSVCNNAVISTRHIGQVGIGKIVEYLAKHYNMQHRLSINTPLLRDMSQMLEIREKKAQETNVRG